VRLPAGSNLAEVELTEVTIEAGMAKGERRICVGRR
jgi:hypothetical protein